VWVALGIHVAWETHRDYWMDHVVVSTTVIPEPTTWLLLSIAIALVTLLTRQTDHCLGGSLTARWCGTPTPRCAFPDAAISQPATESND